MLTQIVITVTISLRCKDKWISMSILVVTRRNSEATKSLAKASAECIFL
jgi:hypothetical protein